jgi:hypothetical protein
MEIEFIEREDVFNKYGNRVFRRNFLFQDEFMRCQVLEACTRIEESHGSSSISDNTVKMEWNAILNR